MPDADKALEQAKKEIAEENYRALVDSLKNRIRNRKSLWDRIFPWKITIIRKDQING